MTQLVWGKESWVNSYFDFGLRSSFQSMESLWFQQRLRSVHTSSSSGMTLLLT